MASATPTNSKFSTSYIDPPTLMRIKHLEMRAKVVVEGFYNGLHRSPYHGFSVEFSEYRQYTPGDDPRYIDWKLFARSDRYYIKRFEDETNLRCFLLVDQSKSMTFGSLAYNKATYASTLAATLAYYLYQQRDAVGMLTFDEGIVDYIPSRYRPGHLHHLMVALERASGGQSTDLTRPIERIAQVVEKRSLVILISDLLAPIDALKTNLGYLRSRGHEVILFRVLDPSDISFPFDTPSLFEDAETGKKVYIDPKSAREEYIRQFTEHSQQIETACNQLGIDIFSFATDRPLELALFDFLNARMRRGKQIQRRSAN